MRSRAHALLPALCIAAATQAGASGGSPTDPVRVLFEGRECPSPFLQVEVWDRGQSAWSTHPSHAFILVDSCQVEDAGYLLNEIRIRCVDPDGQPGTPWRIGVEVFQPGVVDACALPTHMAPLVRIRSPRPGEVVRERAPFVRVDGAVDVSVPEIPEAVRSSRIAAQLVLSTPILREVVVENLSTGESAREVILGPDGRFSASVPVAPGANRLRATALVSEDRVGRAEVEVEFDASLLREDLLRAERERIERIREEQPKRVRIEEESDG
ncbi:MAG: hypothetical protein O7G30_08600 [Proteobacteria bacterium]|nr:hypothetical protein [Pseudomonadota bacterium]